MRRTTIRHAPVPVSGGLALLLAIALLAAGCGDGTQNGDAPAAGGPAPVADAPSVEAPPVDLPPVGTLWSAPTGEGVIPVVVDADGRITIDGKGPLSLAGVLNELRDRTNGPQWREPDRTSRKILLLNADREVPWVVCQWILMIGADPTVGLYKIQFGARPAAGEGFGAVGVELPKDRGIQVTAPFVEELPTISVKLFNKEEFEIDADPEHLYEAIQRMWAQMGNGPEVKLEIKTPPPQGHAVPAGFVIRVVDVAMRVGISDVVFEGSALPREFGGSAARATDVDALLAHVAQLKAKRGGVRIRLGNSFTWDGKPGVDPLPLTSAKGLVPRLRFPVFTPEPSAPSSPAELTARLESEVVDELVEEAAEMGPDPVITDEEIAEHVETDNDLPFEESLGEDGITSGPFTGAAGNSTVGLGGGAGGAFRGRGAGSDLSQRGGPRARGAVEEALRWLAAHQSDNGGWEAAGFGSWCDGERVATGPDGRGKAMYDAGVTGLSICAFLGAGYTNRGRHPYAKVVAKGLRSLKNVQDADGCFGPRTSQHFIYNHACAALAMVEAYGMTESPIFKGSAQRALDFIALARNPHFAWRYGVRPGDNDTSVTAWMMMVLKSAKMINDGAVRQGKQAPLVIDEEAFDGIHTWMEKMTDPETGRVGYIQRGAGSARPQEMIDRFPNDRSEAMTAAAILTRVFLGEDPRESAIIQKGAALCAALPPTWNPTDGSIDLYYWYYGTLALYQVGGRPWKTWNEHLKTAVVDNQRQDTTPCLFKGSWDPIDPWGPDGGRVYATALMAMCLEVYYRYDKVFGVR